MARPAVGTSSTQLRDWNFVVEFQGNASSSFTSCPTRTSVGEKSWLLLNVIQALLGGVFLTLLLSQRRLGRGLEIWSGVKFTTEGTRNFDFSLNYWIVNPNIPWVYPTTIVIGDLWNTAFDTVWLLPGTVQSTGLNLTNGTLIERGWSEHQSEQGSTLVHCLWIVLRANKQGFLQPFLR